mmetsp:Transcript_33489/g.59039  ORF Transcript_33489/g.59039 Transcript_33489/m.59039 type:complete len:94 (+) Transcript_33489:1590-1871(+)
MSLCEQGHIFQDLGLRRRTPGDTVSTHCHMRLYSTSTSDSVKIPGSTTYPSDSMDARMSWANSDLPMNGNKRSMYFVLLWYDESSHVHKCQAS